MKYMNVFLTGHAQYRTRITLGPYWLNYSLNRRRAAHLCSLSPLAVAPAAIV